MISLLCVEHDWCTFTYNRVLYMARMNREMREYSFKDNCWYKLPNDAAVFDALAAWLDSVG